MNARTDIAKYTTVLSALLLALAAGACGGSSSSPATPTPTPGGGGGSITPTFSQVQSQILTPICTRCHVDGGPSGADNLILTASVAYANLVNVPSHEKSSAIRVVPGDPDNSYIVQKLEGASGIVGARMPFGGPFLTADQVSLIRQWIAAGALNN